MRRKQTTITVDGKKIKMVTRPVTSMGDLTGFSTTINGRKMFGRYLAFCCFTAQEAQDRAFAIWMKGEQA